MVKVKEIFTSIQGEGIYVGCKQLFIRLCGCNLNCAYCDTEFGFKDSKEYTADELLKLCEINADCHSVSLTGGEPLLYPEFIKELGMKSVLPLYLETNGTLYENLNQVIDFVTYIAADIKLPSATGLSPLWEEHEMFLKIAAKKDTFAKVVFDNNITDFEIHKISHICKKFDIELILQPKMSNNTLTIKAELIQEILDKCLKIYSNTRLIPQVHKFINVI